MLDIRIIKIGDRYLSIENANGQQHRVEADNIIDAYEAHAPIDRSTKRNPLFFAQLQKVGLHMEDEMCLWLCYNPKVAGVGWFFAQIGQVEFDIGSDNSEFRQLSVGASRECWSIALSMFDYRYEEGIRDNRGRLINKGKPRETDGIV